MEYAYTVARVESEKQKSRRKRNYDRKVKMLKLLEGDRVLVRKVCIQGKSKIGDKWEPEVFTVSKQPDEKIPVYVVTSESGKKKTLHRNMLFPVSYLYSDGTKTSADNQEGSNDLTPEDKELDSSSAEEEDDDVIPAPTASESILEDSDEEDDELSVHEDDSALVQEQQNHTSIEDRVGEQNEAHEQTQEEDPDVTELPRRSTRVRKPPEWQRSGDYITNFQQVSNESEEYFV